MEIEFIPKRREAEAEGLRPLVGASDQHVEEHLVEAGVNLLQTGKDSLMRWYKIKFKDIYINISIKIPWI